MNDFDSHHCSQPALKRLMAFITLAGVWLCCFPPDRSRPTQAALQSKTPPQAATNPSGLVAEGERFDYLVREDFFAGFAGDQARLERAMKVCHDALAKNPKHAEAMVWHGSGTFYLGGQAFQKGDFQTGGELYTRGLNEMDAAVSLQPDSVGVVIPRGATLLQASRFIKIPELAKLMLEKGLNDYEKVLALQQPYFDRLSVHSRTELLFGLAEGWHRFGNLDKARTYFQRVVNEGRGSGHETAAAEWLAKGKPAVNQPTLSCTGCHIK